MSEQNDDTSRILTAWLAAEEGRSLCVRHDGHGVRVHAYVSEEDCSPIVYRGRGGTLAGALDGVAGEIEGAEKGDGGHKN